MKKPVSRPFIFLNAAMTADGKIAPSNRCFKPFGGPTDQRHLLELRATADAVMAGARTIDGDKVKLGPGPVEYRRRRLRQGLAEYNLRVIVSGSGTVDPEAEIFRHRFSPILILTTEKISKARLARLRLLADEVKICGKSEIDFPAACRWLWQKWKVRRLLCEGGGEINGALIQANLVDEIHLTLCPLILGGAEAPTLADGTGVAELIQSARFKLISSKRRGPDWFLIYQRADASA